MENIDEYSVVLKGVSKHFDDGTRVLNSLDMKLRKGKFYTLLGPSGCGKTTTLNIIAGFLDPTTGDVYINGENVNDVPANKRKVNTVFQNYSLFPHMNVFENVAFGLAIKGVDKKTQKYEVDKALDMVQLAGYGQRRITELSGGQQQRIAIARAIVNKPEVLLLDEPLSALDMKLRKSMQVLLSNIQYELGITFVFVTHDQEEALALSDRIFVMDKGKVVQQGPPKDIYNEPLNHYVAKFIGDSNILPGKMIKDYQVEFDGRRFDCTEGGIPENEDVEVIVRPEDVELLKPGEGQLKAKIDNILFRGVFNELFCIDEKGFTRKIHTTKTFKEGDEVGLFIDPFDIHVMRFNESEEDFDARMKKYSGGINA